MKNFKVKKNASELELQEFLLEAEIIVNTSSIENMLTGMILNSLEFAEYLSSFTKRDFTGLSLMLKEDTQFLQLTKILYCKYSVFSKIPVEFQLCLCIVSKGVVCIKKNEIKKKLENKINPNITVENVNNNEIKPIIIAPLFEPIAGQILENH